MNEKQVNIVLVLMAMTICTIGLYFFLFFPGEFLRGSTSSSKSDDIYIYKDSPIPSAISEAKKSKGEVKSESSQKEFSEVILSHQKKGDVETLLEIIHNPDKIAGSGDPIKSARARAFAVRKLLEINTDTAKKAYLSLLEPTIFPDISLAALSALEARYSTPQIQEKIKSLVFHTRFDPVRAKASMVYEKLQKEKDKAK